MQFASPCGEYRFNSQKELELNLGQSITPEKEKSPDLKMNKTPSPSDPFAQKLTILRKRLANGLNHFLRQSLDECALRAQRTQTQSKHHNKHLDNTSNNDCISFNDSKQIVNEESQEYKRETKIAPFTFVNMRQNIFDMTATKRKRILASQGKSNRGRKSKDWLRRNSIAAIHCSSNIDLNNTDMTEKDVKGNATEKALGRANITCNKNGVPFDPEKPMVTSGIRLGTQAITTRGFGLNECKKVGELITKTLKGLSENPDDNSKVEDEVRNEVIALTSSFPIYKNL